MSEGDPVSPGAPDAELEPPDADSESVVDDNQPGGTDDKSPRRLIVFYQKKYFEVPWERVTHQGKPFMVENGLQAHEVHECKSYDKWMGQYSVHTRHITCIEASDSDGKLHTGYYITFKIQGKDSDDPYIIRALHKTIAGKFYDSWMQPVDKGGWSEVKKSKYEALIKNKPSDEAQISPVSMHWKIVPEPSCVLYERPKKERAPAEGELKSAIKKKVPKGKASAKKDTLLDDEDDDQSSAAQSSTALVPANLSGGMMGMPGMGMGGAGSANFFMQTPGTLPLTLCPLLSALCPLPLCGMLKPTVSRLQAW